MSPWPSQFYMLTIQRTVPRKKQPPSEQWQLLKSYCLQGEIESDSHCYNNGDYGKLVRRKDFQIYVKPQSQSSLPTFVNCALEKKAFMSDCQKWDSHPEHSENTPELGEQLFEGIFLNHILTQTD